MDTILYNLWRRYKKEDDPAAREELILHYIPYAHKRASYAFYKLGFLDPPYQEDLQAISHEVLCQKLPDYDPDNLKGASFETYVSRAIFHAILNSNEVAGLLPRSRRRLIGQVQKAHDALMMRGIRPTTEAIAANTNLGIIAVRWALTWLSLPANQQPGLEEDEEDDPMDRLPDKQPAVEEQAETDIRFKTLEGRLQELVNTGRLTRRECVVFVMRLFDVDYKEIAAKLGEKADNLRAVYRRTLEKIKNDPEIKSLGLDLEGDDNDSGSAAKNNPRSRDNDENDGSFALAAAVED
jgi:RNA polymerase sigma factor (sigma-70 family)